MEKVEESFKSGDYKTESHIDQEGHLIVVFEQSTASGIVRRSIAYKNRLPHRENNRWELPTSSTKQEWVLSGKTFSKEDYWIRLLLLEY